MSQTITIYFNISRNNYKLLLKTRDNRRQITLLDFKKFVLQKFKRLFKVKFEEYIWLLLDEPSSVYIVAKNDDFIKHGTKVRVLLPNEDAKNIEDVHGIVDSIALLDLSGREDSESSSSSTPHSKTELHSSGNSQGALRLPANGCHESRESLSHEEPQIPANLDHKPLLIGLVRKYNEEFLYFLEKGAFDQMDMIWRTIAQEMSTKLKSISRTFTSEECKEEFELLLSLYISILKFTSSKAVQHWQFFTTFHNELYLKPFEANIDALKKEFEERP